jgi:hypothetical protein
MRGDRDAQLERASAVEVIRISAPLRGQLKTRARHAMRREDDRPRPSTYAETMCDG